MATFTKEELEKFSLVYDTFGEKIKEFFKRGAIAMRPLQKEISEFAEKNADVLQTNIIGKQLLLNDSAQEKMLDIIGIDLVEMKNTIKASEYFKKFGDFNLINQLVFSIPFLLLSREFYNNNKDAESKFFYTFAFYKPYAARISRYFPYGVNSDQMLYTIEHLTERFDIKRYGILNSVIEKKAETSYNNYIQLLSDNPSDRNLHLIFTAGIYSSINSFINNITAEYHKNKGNYLPFEKSTFEGTDDSEGETFEKDIKSESAVKTNAIHRSLLSLSKNPIDINLLDVAARFGFIGLDKTYGEYRYTGGYTEILKNTLEKIIDAEFQMLPKFFESIIGSFLSEINPATGRKFTSQEFKSPVFLTGALKLFKNKNTRDINIINTRKMLNDMLEKHSGDYINFGKTQRAKLKNAVYFYFVLLIQKGGS